ncbi:exported hypothetical protein [Clostridiaceae bacterium BL-3]|nr:exported hypothetical protein [Clostridiaceae bacterium BL-3]
MLRFNQRSKLKSKSRGLNLNTSHVKVQPKFRVLVITSSFDLNTSHVKVQQLNS